MTTSIVSALIRTCRARTQFGPQTLEVTVRADYSRLVAQPHGHCNWVVRYHPASPTKVQTREVLEPLPKGGSDTLGLATDDSINLDLVIHVRDCVGFHDIEMLVAAEKPNIPGWHCGALILGLGTEKTKEAVSPQRVSWG